MLFFLTYCPKKKENAILTVTLFYSFLYFYLFIFPSFWGFLFFFFNNYYYLDIFLSSEVCLLNSLHDTFSFGEKTLFGIGKKEIMAIYILDILVLHDILVSNKF